DHELHRQDNRQYSSLTRLYPLSLHDALPIYHQCFSSLIGVTAQQGKRQRDGIDGGPYLRQQEIHRAHHHGIGNHGTGTGGFFNRSEEHTSELQSRENLVCRLLPEKKKRLATT